MKKIDGIVPVMLTPFTENNEIDYDSLSRLIDWYIENGADALFSVCQSSEMLFLSLEERVKLSRFVVDYTNKRVPVISSGHISNDMDKQIEELNAIAKTGIDALVLVTNRLDPENKGTDIFKQSVDTLIASLPTDLALGIYECPVPYRRLLSDDELMYCANTGRFVVLKDVSCDLETVTRRVKLVANTPLAIINANAAIAFDAMKAGSKGFSGVFTNFHPDLYHWLYHSHQTQPEYAQQLAWFLSLSAMAESLGYPKNAKIFQQQLGNFVTPHCRVTKDDVLIKYWALDSLLDQIKAASDWHRTQIAHLSKQ